MFQVMNEVLLASYLAGEPSGTHLERNCRVLQTYKYPAKTKSPPSRVFQQMSRPGAGAEAEYEDSSIGGTLLSGANLKHS